MVWREVAGWYDEEWHLRSLVLKSETRGTVLFAFVCHNPRQAYRPEPDRFRTCF